MKRLFVVLAALFLVIPGCASVPGPTPSSISESYIDTFDRTWDATIRSLKSNEFSINQIKRGDKSGVILAMGKNGNKLRLEVEHWTWGTIYVHIVPDGRSETKKMVRILHRDIQQKL